MTGLGERVSKFLAQAGVASRRHAEGLIREGRVVVNDHVAFIGEKITPGKDRVYVDGEEICGKECHIYVMLNKPSGYLSSCYDPFGRPTVISLVQDVKQRIFPVGRLDLDAEGLLLLTNDGYLTYLLTHPRHKVIKEYVVEVLGKRDERKIRRILSGIIIGDRRVEVDYARFLDARKKPLRLLIGVHEGEKHLVKRICQAVGYSVKKLTRTKIGPVSLSGVAKGKWRYLTDDEVRALYNAARKGREGEDNARKS